MDFARRPAVATSAWKRAVELLQQLFVASAHTTLSPLGPALRRAGVAPYTAQRIRTSTHS